VQGRRRGATLRGLPALLSPLPTLSSLTLRRCCLGPRRGPGGDALLPLSVLACLSSLSLESVTLGPRGLDAVAALAPSLRALRLVSPRQHRLQLGALSGLALLTSLELAGVTTAPLLAELPGPGGEWDEEGGEAGGGLGDGAGAGEGGWAEEEDEEEGVFWEDEGDWDGGDGGGGGSGGEEDWADWLAGPWPPSAAEAALREAEAAHEAALGEALGALRALRALRVRRLYGAGGALQVGARAWKGDGEVWSRGRHGAPARRSLVASAGQVALP
jgi:hypothetical protein